jgi:hypothetical protein
MVMLYYITYPDCRVVDPYSFDTDPDPILILGFYDQKLKEFTVEIVFKFFYLNNFINNYNLPIPRPP